MNRKATIATLLLAFLLAGCVTIQPGGERFTCDQDSPSGCPWGHTLRSGETVETVARFYGVAVKTITEANPGVEIGPGVSITVPCPDSTPEPVQAADTADYCWDGRDLRICDQE